MQQCSCNGHQQNFCLHILSHLHSQAPNRTLCDQNSLEESGNKLINFIILDSSHACTKASSTSSYHPLIPSPVTPSSLHLSHPHPFTCHTLTHTTGLVTALNVTSTTNTTVSVRWAPPTVTSGAILGYAVQVNYTSDDGRVIHTTANITMVTVTELLPGTEYNITVSAQNSGGFGDGLIISATTIPNSESICCTG